MTRARINQVAAVAREDDVVILPAVDGVRGAVGGLGGFDAMHAARVDQAQRSRGLDCLQRGLRHDTVVAEEDIGAGVAGDGVAAGDHVVAVRGTDTGVDGRHGHGASVAIGAGWEADRAVENGVEAGVAEDDVAAAVALDHVIAAAPGQVVAGLATADDIVIEAAVDGHGAERGASIDRVPVVAGDHGEPARVRGRHSRNVVVLAAVLRRVAVDDERRCQRDGCRRRPSRRSDGDGVAAGATVDHSDAALHTVRGHRAVDGEGIVAGPEQDVEDLHGAVGDAARAAEAGQGGSGERADIVGCAAVVENVDPVDRVRFIDRREVETVRAGVRLGRQDDRRDEGAIRSAAREALDLERSADQADRVRLEREGLQGEWAGRVVGADDGESHVSRHANRIVAEMADHRRHHARTRAEDEEVVVALHPVDLERLRIHIGGVDAGAEDAGVGDDEVVAELGSQDRDVVEPVAAVDRHASVEVVQDGDRRRGAALIRQGKRAEEEGVVAVVAVEMQFGLVAVDREVVVADSAVGDRSEADAAAEVAARGQSCVERVLGGYVREGPRRAEQLTELEGVVAGPAVEGRAGAVVVAGEVVIAAETAHDEIVDVDVVIDAFDAPVERVGHRLFDRAVQQGDEGRRIGVRAADQVARPAEQEYIRCGGAVDRQYIRTVTDAPGVEDVDDVVARRRGGAAGRVDGVDVGAGLTVEVQGVAPGGDAALRRDERPRRVHRLELFDGEGVRAVAGRRRAAGGRRRVASVGKGLTAQEGPLERERIVVDVAEESRAGGGPAARREGAAQGRIGAEAGVAVGRPVVQVVQVDVDGLTGRNRRVRMVDQVVADAQLDPAAGADETIGHGARRILDEQHVARNQQLEVFVQRRRNLALAHGEADVAAGADRRARLDQAEGSGHFGEIDVGRGFQADVADRAARRVDFDVAAVSTGPSDTAAVRPQIDRVGQDERRVGGQSGPRAAVEDRPRPGDQRDVAPVRIDPIESEVAGNLLDVNTIEGGRGEDAGLGPGTQGAPDVID